MSKKNKQKKSQNAHDPAQKPAMENKQNNPVSTEFQNEGKHQSNAEKEYK